MDSVEKTLFSRYVELGEHNSNLEKRIIELETELRLVKEQQSEAQKTVVNLARYIGNQDLYGLSKGSPSALETARDEIDHLRRSLTTALEVRRDRGLASNTTGHKAAEAGQPDLLSFDDHHKPAASASTSFGWGEGTEDATLNGSSNETPFMTGTHTPCLKAAENKQSSTETSTTFVNLNSNDVQNGVQAEAIYNGLPIFRPFLKDDQHLVENSQPSPIEGRLILFPRQFTISEHKFLAGNATFIEDMSEDEKKQYFRGIPRKRSHHTAEEWQSYYEETVKPEYLAWEREKAKARAEKGALKQVSKSDCISPSESTAQNLEVEAGGVAMAGKADCVKGGDHGDLQKTGSATMVLIELDANAEQEHALVAETAAPIDARETLVEDGSEGSKETETQERAIDSIETQVGDLSLENQKSTEIEAKIETEQQASKIETSHRAHQNLTEVHPSTPPYTPSASPVKEASSHPSRRSLFARPTQVPDDVFELVYDWNGPETLRAVMISNIPANIRLLSKVLAKVRGGKIVSATFLNTAGMKTIPPITTNCVRIEFLNAEAAREYVEFCREHGIFFSTSNKPGDVEAEQFRARVNLIPTPTRPINHKLEWLMYKKDLTRVLYLFDTQHDMDPERVVRDLRLDGGAWPISEKMDKGEKLTLEFRAASQASRAWNLVGDWNVMGLEKGFLKDPCEGAVAELMG